MSKIVKNRFALLLTLVFVFALTFTNITVFADGIYDSISAEASQEELFEKLEGKKAGVVTGTPHDEWIAEKVKNVQFSYFNSLPDAAFALSQGKVDYIVQPQITTLMMKPKYKDLVSYENAALRDANICAVFPINEGGQKRCREMNEYISKLKADGTLDKLQEIWFTTDDVTEEIEIPKEGKNGVLKAAACSALAPFCYNRNGKLAGCDIQLLAMFCKEYGYGLEIQDMDFASVITGVGSGKYDISINQITYTDERAESLLFSDPYNVQKVCVVTNGNIINTGTHHSANLTFDDLKGKTAGAVTGTPHDIWFQDKVEDVDVLYFNSFADCAQALSQGKIDMMTTFKVNCEVLSKEYENLQNNEKLLLKSLGLGAIFAKSSEGGKYQQQMNEFLDNITKNGELKKLEETWITSDEVKESITIPTDAKNGTLKVAVNSSMFPFVYIRDGQLAGHDVALAAKFCEQYGYALELHDMDYGALVSAVSSGKYDFAIGEIGYTEERAESVLYSSLYYDLKMTVLTNNGIAAADDDNKDFLSSIGESFYKTFIKESRWVLIVEGIGMTLAITGVSAAGGILLGLFIYFIKSKGNKFLKVLVKIYTSILAGTPIVVLLMIIYYIIFGKADFPAFWVAVIAFGMNFSASASEIFFTTFNGIDRGQTEAALALGYRPVESFIRFILPQAAQSFIPLLKGQIISLLKGTAVVGYIAIQDLTKVGDIIRSRTYEAFFPLIAIAVIYFIFSWLIGFVISRIEIKIDPVKKRDRRRRQERKKICGGDKK